MNTAIKLTDIKTKKETVYKDIKEALKATKLTLRLLKQRATNESIIDNILYSWVNPSTKRSFLGKKSRRKGHNWELEIILNLKDIGYTGCVSARSESKRMDDAKIDIVDIDNKLPCYIQAKATKNYPNFHKIANSCPKKDKPFVIACKIANKGTLAMLPLDYFYKLISLNNES